MFRVSTNPFSKDIPSIAPKVRDRVGMTLAEVMIAACVLFLVGAGILGVLISTYRLVSLTRYSDNARAMLVAFGDQFYRSNPLDLSDPTHMTMISNSMWSPTGTTASPYGTGVGLQWETTIGTATGLPVTLGNAANSSIPAQIFRQVSYVQASYPYVGTDGIAVTAPTDLVTATFTILFTVNGQQKVQTLSVARIWRNAN